LGLIRIIEIYCEKAAAEGEDDPGFTIVHGGVVEKLRVVRLVVTGTGLDFGFRTPG
jgi:hypothetical protein